MPSKTVLVVDASILIDLYKADVLDKIKLLPYQMEMADFVWHEVIYPDPAELETLGLSPTVFSEEEIDEIALLQATCKGLSAADCSNIILAKKLSRKKRVVFLGVHDSALFREAKRQGVACKDGLDLLDELVVAKAIDLGLAHECLPHLGRGRPEVVMSRTTELIEKWHKNR